MNLRVVRDNRKDPTDWSVYCEEGCGLVFLDKQSYGAQMNRPNSTWRCPSCGGSAMWDDNCRETNPPEDTEHE